MENVLSLLCVIGLYNISLKFSYLNYNNKNNIILTAFNFSLIIFFIYIVNSYLFILNLSSKLFSIFLLITSLFFAFTFLSKNFLKIYSFINNNFKSKLIIISIISFFILAYISPSDEDSIRYHLEIPQKIIDDTFYKNAWFDYITIGANEFINLFGLHFKFLNTSSVLNFVYLLFIILSNNFFFKKKSIGSNWLGNFLIISSPYIIALMASQKMYLLPCYIAAYSIAYLYVFKDQIFYKNVLVIISLNIFIVIIKPIFLPYLGIVIFYSLFILKYNLKKKIYLLFFFFSIFIIAYLPIGIIKYKIYQDPFLPILSINKLNLNWWNLYSKEVLTASQMDFTDHFSKIHQALLVPVKLIIPLQPGDLFKTLGIGMFFLYFLEYKKNKILLLLILLFTSSVLILNNYQSRWFLPLLLLVSIFIKETKFIILNNLAKYQFIFSLLIIIPFSLLSLIPNFFDLNKKLFSQKQIVDVMNNKYKNEKYFSNLNSFFYLKNEIPVYITQKDILIIYDNKFFKRNAAIKLFLYEEKEGNFNEFIKKNSLCSEYEILEKFSYNPRRFFLINSKRDIKLYKLLC
jgi:hypothetical protein